MNVLVYLMKVVLVSGILFGYYRLFLRNKSFHRYNRFYLLSVLVLALLLPFVRIPIGQDTDNVVNQVVYHTVDAIAVDIDEPAEEMAETGNRPGLEVVTILLYGAGMLFLLGLLGQSLVYIYRLKQRYRPERIDTLRFYNTHEPGAPFSFFRSVFWHEALPIDTPEGQQIFRHELFHVRQRHSVDRIMAEVFTAVFWFNPFFHWIKKELKAIHEFLADEYAVSGSDRYAYATLLVQQALDQRKHHLTNHFFQDHIKRRIAMITQFKHARYGYWSRVMVLPLSILLFFTVALYAKAPAATGTGTGHPWPHGDIAAPVQDTVPKKNETEQGKKEVKERKREIRKNEKPAPDQKKEVRDEVEERVDNEERQQLEKEDERIDRQENQKRRMEAHRKALEKQRAAWNKQNRERQRKDHQALQEAQQMFQKMREQNDVVRKELERNWEMEYERQIRELDKNRQKNVDLRKEYEMQLKKLNQQHLQEIKKHMQEVEQLQKKIHQLQLDQLKENLKTQEEIEKAREKKTGVFNNSQSNVFKKGGSRLYANKSYSAFKRPMAVKRTKSGTLYRRALPAKKQSPKKVLYKSRPVKKVAPAKT